MENGKLGVKFLKWYCWHISHSVRHKPVLPAIIKIPAEAIEGPKNPTVSAWRPSWFHKGFWALYNDNIQFFFMGTLLEFKAAAACPSSWPRAGKHLNVPFFIRTYHTMRDRRQQYHIRTCRHDCRTKEQQASLLFIPKTQGVFVKAAGEEHAVTASLLPSWMHHTLPVENSSFSPAYKLKLSSYFKGAVAKRKMNYSSFMLKGLLGHLVSHTSHMSDFINVFTATQKVSNVIVWSMKTLEFVSWWNLSHF